MSTKDLIIKGGKSKLDTSYLEAISARIIHARSVGARVEISLTLFQRVLHELIQRRRQDLADSKELDEIISSMEGETFVLPVSESRQGGTIDLNDLEITDLDQLGGDSAYEILEGPRQEQPEPEPEPEEELEEIVLAPKRRTTLAQKRREYWLPALNPYRVLFISLLGVFILIALVLFGG